MEHSTEIVVFIISITFLLLGLSLHYVARILKRIPVQEHSESYNDHKEFNIYKNLFITGACFILLFHFGYREIQKAGVEAHVLEWINIVLRWAHVVLGIAWIGASFYFIFLENSLNRNQNLRDELAGNLWAIHGGGFYYVEKYKTAPADFPAKLHWFKYEAYFTWLTGFILLILVYYMNAKAFMVDPAIRDLDPNVAVGIGIGTIILGWILYDLLCSTPLVNKKYLFAFTGFVIVTAISFFLSNMLSGRAAFMHVGALLGTIMAGNVFFVIIPSQKALVKAALQNKPVDPSLGMHAGLRSLHNNYITLPVIFIMISGHFPTTYGSQFNWAVLAGLTLTSVAVRHFINMYEKGKYVNWVIPFAVVGLVALVFATAPKSSKPGLKNTAPVSFTEIQPIIQKRCIQCHSSNPTDELQKVAPNGIMLDTKEQIEKQKDRILFRVVQTKTMPQGNKTGITEEERELLERWIVVGEIN